MDARTAPTTASDAVRPGMPLSSGAAPTAEVFNLDEAVQKCFGKYDLFCDMVGSLFDEAPPLLERMQAALLQKDSKELTGAAHRLKGTVVYLGGARATEAARRVEQHGRAADLSAAAAALEELKREVALLQAALAPHHGPRRDRAQG